MKATDDNLSSTQKSHDENQHHHPLWHYMIAGGIGGVTADFIMHPLDTMKTRQQASADTIKTMDLKLRNLHPIEILKLEGLKRGWYSGLSAAMLGSFPSAAIFFVTYEFLKDSMIHSYHINETVSFFIAGLSGDLASSLVYVPSEVLKTRLQLQGHLNRKLFGYHNLRDAVVKMNKYEGKAVFYSGYNATLLRDLPFSAIQFALYEKFRQLSCKITNKTDEELGVTEELLVGALAGGISGAVTTPLDVVKTRLQTDMSQVLTASGNKNSALVNKEGLFSIIIKFYRTEGLRRFFGGIVPRILWSSVQSSIMLYIYQTILKQSNSNSSVSKKM